MDTSMGLSSIATLSLGLSMSMAGAGRAVMRSLGPGHRQALQQFFPVIPDATFTGMPPRRRPTPSPCTEAPEPAKQGSDETDASAGQGQGASEQQAPGSESTPPGEANATTTVPDGLVTRTGESTPTANGVLGLKDGQHGSLRSLKDNSSWTCRSQAAEIQSQATS